MYESFYHCRTKPFALVPDCDFLYAGATHRAAYSVLEYGLLSQAPFIVLTGEPGTGKTSLLQKLVAEHRTSHTIGLVTNARYDVEHLLPWILLALGLCQRQLDPVEAYHIFTEFLAKECRQHRRVIVVVDEAQSLGVELLEELRLLSNMNEGKQVKLQIILSGQPDLHHLLKRIDMTQFAQRIVADYHLEPLADADTARFIRHRLQIAGAQPDLFTDKACALVHRLSRGNPRLIVQLCDIALTYGFAEQARAITSKIVAQAALDRSRGGILPLTGRDELAAVIAAPEDPKEVEASRFPLRSADRSQEAETLSEPLSPQMSFEEGLMLKKDGRWEDAIAMFERAGQNPALWLKAYGQIGLCYRAVGNTRAALAAFRAALRAPSAPRRDMQDVRYFLARTLESAGQSGEALALYRRLAQVDPAFRDAAFRAKTLSGRARSGSDARRKTEDGESWLGGAIQRLIGSHK